MQLGILHTSLGEKTLEGSFRLAAKAGAEGIEVCYDDAGDFKALKQADHAAKLKDLAEKHALAVPSLCLGQLRRKPSLIGTPKAIATAQNSIRQALCVAAAVGAGVVLVPFLGKNAIEVEDELIIAAEALTELVEDAENAGVIIGVETTLNPSQQQFLLDYLGGSGNVRIYYDTGEASARKLDVAGSIRNLGADKIAQIHLKDTRIEQGAPPDFEVALGEGNVDFHAVAQAILAVGYDGWIVLETPPGTNPLQSAKANLAFARELINASA